MWTLDIFSRNCPSMDCIRIKLSLRYVPWSLSFCSCGSQPDIMLNTSRRAKRLTRGTPRPLVVQRTLLPKTHQPASRIMTLAMLPPPTALTPHPATQTGSFMPLPHGGGAGGGVNGGATCKEGTTATGGPNLGSRQTWGVIVIVTLYWYFCITISTGYSKKIMTGKFANCSILTSWSWDSPSSLHNWQLHIELGEILLSIHPCFPRTCTITNLTHYCVCADILSSALSQAGIAMRPYPTGKIRVVCFTTPVKIVSRFCDRS